MIDLNELKPVLEPLLGDDAADVIDQITALDTHNTDSDVKEAVDKVNAEWQERYRNAFFHGDAAQPTQPATPKDPDPAPPTDEVPSLDDLIYPDGK